jgi:uncharacterized RDD family membrane protein YckC
LQRAIGGILDYLIVYYIIKYWVFADIGKVLPAEWSPTLCLLISAIIALSYFLVSEILFSRTLGKLLVNTKVVSDYGRKPSIFSFFLRTYGRILPFEFVPLLYGKPAFHDESSNTTVITLPFPFKRK